ncbi:uncharacterized protein METZ01_LOCUS233030 [marine metagenome]|uniref:Uncharacterized protein n=1 Tax=marine metagenome TaxID=408172 RepID=A0A382GYK7_9ZZZZ
MPKKYASIGAPAKYKSPIESNILWRTNSSLNLRPSLFKILLFPTTTAFSSDPPRAKPFERKYSTSFSNPNVLAEETSVL